MLRFFRNAIIGSSLLLLGVAANAQSYQERDEYRHFSNNANVVDQVRADLNEALNMGNLSGSQRNVLAEARNDLAVFDRAWDRGSFNRRELDEAIARIQSVANSGRISEEQRAMLQDDMERLRNFRSSQAMSNGFNPDNGYYNRYNGYNRTSGYMEKLINFSLQTSRESKGRIRISDARSAP